MRFLFPGVGWYISFPEAIWHIVSLGQPLDTPWKCEGRIHGFTIMSRRAHHRGTKGTSSSGFTCWRQKGVGQVQWYPLTSNQAHTHTQIRAALRFLSIHNGDWQSTYKPFEFPAGPEVRGSSFDKVARYTLRQNIHNAQWPAEITVSHL